MKYLVVMLLLIGCNVKDVAPKFGCWELYIKCPDKPVGQSETFCGKSDDDMKYIIDIISKDCECNCKYSYKLLK